MLSPFILKQLSNPQIFTFFAFQIIFMPKVIEANSCIAAPRPIKYRSTLSNERNNVDAGSRTCNPIDFIAYNI